MFKEPKGVDIPKNKDRTMNKPIEPLSPPEYVYFPMNMHIGKPAKISVKVGDKVLIGDKLGDQSGFMSSHISSSVSGEVVDIKKMVTLRGENEVIVIKNDGEFRENLMEPLTGEITVDQLVDRIEEAGIVGKGGAGFPTKIKYKNEAKDIDYIIINGSECEGYSTTDYRVMVEHADEIVEMVAKLMEIYDAKEAYIAIERVYDEPIKAITEAINKYGVKNFRIHTLGTSYPQGHDALQIREVLGTEVPNALYPADLGIIQSNVSTVKAIHDAVFKGLHASRRVVTVSGDRLKDPKNLLVPIGAPISHLIAECGGVEGDKADIKYINGGPMMGKSFDNLDAPIEKNTTTILALTEPIKRKETACIRCGRCVDVCPVGLIPVAISRAYRNEEIYKGLSLRSRACISCGSCTYTCPAHIPLLENIQSLNRKLGDQLNAKNS